ncbi:Protein FAM126B [Glycine soja]
MEFHRSDSSSSPSSSTPTPNNADPNKTSSSDPMHSWWESVSKARSRIHALAAILPSSSSDSLSSLADSDRPALSLLSSPAAYAAVSSSLSGSHSDPLCHWLYDTFLSSDPHLRLVVLSFVPLLSGLYLSRIHSPEPPSLAGFEAVLLALYAAETKSRNGKPLVVTIPDLSHPSIYHAPLRKPQSQTLTLASTPSVGLISPPLEPQLGVKSTKRASIVGVALHSFFSQISHMPAWSKLEFCQFAAAWAGSAHCPCRNELDRNGKIEDFATAIENVRIRDGDYLEEGKGERIPLPWEILQPSLRILGHCLLGPLNSQDVKDAASFAVRCLYARASHDLVPQAILATRSLIQLDVRTREAARANAATNSNANTPTKAKKPEILLVSK